MPEGEAFGFVILVKDGAGLMIQSLASVHNDEPKFAVASHASLFIEVERLRRHAETARRLPIAMPQRDTFYGMREIGVFEPGGHTIVFAKRLAEAATS